MTSKPLVSVLMPVYNAQDYVAQSIRSVWDQSHRPIELIVVDDGSTDGSNAIVAELVKQAPIPMQFWRQENAGPAAALHNALQRATGEWVGWLAADDLYAPNFMARNLEVAGSLPQDELILHSSAFLIEADDRKIGTIDEISKEPPFRGRCFDFIVDGHGRMLPSTMFIRRDLLLKVGGFDPEMEVEDTDLFLRLARAGEFHYIDEQIFCSRWTPGSFGKKPWKWGNSTIKALSKHADILGSRLPVLLTKASSNICQNCFEYGEWGHGLRWGAKAVHFAPGIGAKARVTGQLGYRVARAGIRNLAYRLLGRDRLVRIKRVVSPSAQNG